MEADDAEPFAELAVRLIEALGPVPFVVLSLALLLIWQLPKLWTRAERAAPPPAPADPGGDARALGRVEGLVEGHAERLDAIEARLTKLENRRTRS